ncbi:MAG: signal recognition particle-docking protein FtsY [Clostridia bacterium]|nr:signal recognition particle-docking protein FtsY [Clostridia bacterium]
MAFLAKLFGKKKDNKPDEEALAEEEGLTPEEPLDEDLVSAAAAEAAEAALLSGEELTEAETSEEEIPEETVTEETPAEEIPAEVPAQEPVVEEVTAEEPVVEEVTAETPAEEPVAEEEIEETATKKSFWGRLKSGLTKTRNALFAPVDNLLKAFTKVDEDLLEELEEILISADVGFTATEEIMEELRERIKDGRLKEKEQVMDALREIMTDMIGQSQPLNLTTTPSVLLVIGVNGAGKTTSIGKISKRLRLQGKKVVVAAADTFRAAAIDQLAVWCERAKVDMVRQNEGSDPAAVVFDAIAAAKKKQADVLIIDTAGRLQNKKNLMNELAKIDRVIDRELPGACRETLLVLDATTGQNAVSQAKEFGNAAKITGITLNKLDGTAKGGIVISIKRELGIPVKFIGVGEKIDDMQEFDAEDFVSALFGE